MKKFLLSSIADFLVLILIASFFVGIVWCEEAPRPFLGVVFEHNTVTGGVKIAMIYPGSSAYECGIMPGDLLESIDGFKFSESEQVSKFLKSKNIGDTIEIIIKRSGNELSLKVKLKPMPESVKDLSNAHAFYNQGRELHSGGNIAEAINLWQKAIDLLKQIKGAEKLQADCYANIGLALDDLEKYKEALDAQEKALDLYKGTEGTEKNQADCHRNIGATFWKIGKYQETIVEQEKALELYKHIKGSQEGQADCLKNIGVAFWKLGKYESIAKLQKALNLYNTIAGTENDRADCYVNIGLILCDLGQYEDNIVEQKKALVLYKNRKGTENDQANCYVNIGEALYKMGKYKEAIAWQEKALNSYKDTEGMQGRRAVCYANIGLALIEQGEYKNSIARLEVALKKFGSIEGTKREQAACWQNIGLVFCRWGKYKEAVNSQSQALNLYKNLEGTELQIVSCFGNTGEAFLKAGELDSALKAYKYALTYGDSWWLSLGLARTYQQLGDLEKAASWYMKAVYLAERKREQILGKEARIGVFENPAKALAYLSLFLVTTSEQGILPTEKKLTLWTSQKEVKPACLEIAFHFAEVAKARTSLDILQERDLNLKEKEPAKLLKDDRILAKQIEALHSEKIFAQQPKIAEIEKQIKENQLERDLIEFKLKKTLIGNYQKPDFKRVTDIQKELSPQTAALEYVVLEDETIGFLLTKDSINAFRIPVKSKPSQEIDFSSEHAFDLLAQMFIKDHNSPGLEALVKLYRMPMEEKKDSNLDRIINALQLTEDVQIEVGEHLADLLIPKVTREILAEKKISHLLIIPDGVLYYLPFNALILSCEGKTKTYRNCDFLVERYSISYAPSLALLDVIRLQAKQREKVRRNERKKLLAFANPVFCDSDPRIKSVAGREKQDNGESSFLLSYYNEIGKTFPILELTQDEAKGIAELFKPYIVQEAPEMTFPKTLSCVLIGLAANIKKARAIGVKDYQFLHFATHGQVDTSSPWLSCLALTNPIEQTHPAFLKVDDVMGMDLDADLVTLSACETGLGDVKRGEGLIGFSTSFFYAGTSSLSLSLWPVPTQKSGEMMKDFYHGFAKNKLSKAKALQQAQINLIKTLEYPHPWFWAAFILTGEYK